MLLYCAVQTSRGNLYQLSVDVPGAYPACDRFGPPLLIVFPDALKDHSGTPLSEYGVSASMHLLPALRGYPRLCHTQYWQANDTIVKVLEKGVLWLHAYDAHLRTGRPVSHYIRETRASPQVARD